MIWSPEAMTSAERRARAWRSYNSRLTPEVTEAPESREAAPCGPSCQFFGCGCETTGRTA